MDFLFSVLAATLLSLTYAIVRSFRRRAVGDLPGPKPESFLMGNLDDIHRNQAGEADFRWQEQYGGIARIKAPFGEDMLWISDPRALQYIYQTSGYSFPKQPERRALSRLLGDHGLTWADGDTHKRQRKVMLPAFGSPESKALLPVFQQYAERVMLKWKDVLDDCPDHTAVVNIIKDIAPATLDAIGQAAFDYKLGCMDDTESELARGFRNLIADVLCRPSKMKVFCTSMARFIPMRLSEILYDHLPGKGLDKARENKQAAHNVAHQLLEMKSDALLLGKGNRDIMSILVKANASENEKTRLTHEEMISQMRTILLAGQETTSNTLSFGLYELAKHPHYQARLRAEIRETERSIRERGDATFSPSDLDSMPYLQAVVREILRFDPVVPHNFRMAAKDDVLPLSKPIRTLSGRVVGEVPIPKGIRLVLSIAAYNRDKEVWGADAHTFNPERLLDFSGKRGPTVGVFANIAAAYYRLTFSGGIRACIGWRFAVYELQSFLVHLISNFEFSLTEEVKHLRRENALVMIPTLEGEEGKGPQLPLNVSLAPRD
ncbi:cytochrome P450 [Laetiporus sulphureus 93-53]|uniref:Cytochrome P450 n=1 Tax=Laetiporus sulphureus 93-53 TaxID=1314785 RepID=A0A165BQK4_9APHY|nr:cytochrome P450 [Laetiporus sulphureus 93-53]KZT01474.1 cytochrome P450 [Laetiporus sulphureus 93-53]